jgi:hypothetical protein
MANEGDAAVAVLSFFSVVLTNERPENTGPLRFAFENGGKIFYLSKLPAKASSLRGRIVSCFLES